MRHTSILPLLRNHRYLVNIKAVGGPGFDTEEDARKGPAANIMYNVVVWNESTMSDVLYDGQYMLGVSADHFTFYREGGSLTAKVQTSWPEGFTVEGLPAWISYSIIPSDPDKTAPTDEKTGDLYGHRACGCIPNVAGKAGRCSECVESRLCEGGAYEMVPWF